MFRLDLGGAGRYCDGLNRRSFLKLGVSGMASVGLPQLLQARHQSAPTGSTRNTSVILIWLDGGPSHMDLYDLKPEAPAEYRGIWKPIPTRVPGFDISELFPKQAKVTDKFSIVRSLHHGTGDHFAGGHRMLTTKDMGLSGANNEGKFPGIGAIVTRELGARRQGMPGYVAVPYASSIGLTPGYFGGHMLGSQYNPFAPGGDPNAPNYTVQNLNLAQGLSLDRLGDRRSLVKHFDTTRRQLDGLAESKAMDKFSREAYEFISGPLARKAFDINTEDPRLRDRYGRHSWGQSTLLARRLVEAGVTFVTVHMGGWDDHAQVEAAMKYKLPVLDRALSALVSDLSERGLYERVALCVCGEFGRTPRINPSAGRDHWGESGFALLGGGGLKTGLAVGATTDKGEYPKERPVSPGDLLATLYQVLGIDTSLSFTDRSGRPHPILREGTPIAELV